MQIRDYRTGDAIRPAEDHEVIRYFYILNSLSQSERDAGAVLGEEFGIPGSLVFLR